MFFNKLTKIFNSWIKKKIQRTLGVKWNFKKSQLVNTIELSGKKTPIFPFLETWNGTKTRNLIVAKKAWTIENYGSPKTAQVVNNKKNTSI